jgi:ketosteroid isomerase-like protein
MSSTPPGPESVNKECIRGWLRAREGEYDLEHMAQFLTEDIVRYGPRPTFVEGNPREAEGLAEGPAAGRERVMRGWLPEFLPYQYGSIEVDIEHILAEGDYVAAQYVMRARTRRGEPYENFYFMLYLCEGGRIKAYWEYVDTLYSQNVLFADASDD